MSYNLSQLVTSQTSDQELATLLTNLSANGYAATSWQSGGVQRTIVELMAIALSEQSTLIAEIANGAHLDNATGEWLTVLASGFYQEERDPAQSAVYTVVLTESDGTPHTINVGDLWLGTTDGRRYANITGGELLASGELSVEVQAESPGASYNTGAGTIIVNHTPIPGVTCTNTSANPETAGLDEESDEALRERCKAKWAAMGAGGTIDAYTYWARAASTSVRKVKVKTDIAGGGIVTVAIAGDTSGLGAGIVATVQAYILARCPTVATPVTASATTEAVNITATVRVASAYAAAYEAAANAALDALFVAVPIGGSIDNSDFVVALGSITGVDRVVMTAPSGDAAPSVDTALLVKGAVTLSVVSI